jgi:hypothetical protein
MPFGQELIFILSMAVICAMLVLVTRDLDPINRRAIFFTCVIIFAFRATPSVGDGYFWWTLDVLKFDEAFYGTLRQMAAFIAIAAMWIFSKQLTEYSVTTVLFWLAVAGAILSLPNIGLFYGLHHWTEENFGFGARTIAIIDAATTSPFAQLSMIPLLTLIAFFAPGWSPSDMVRLDGFADEPGAGSRPATDEIFEPNVRGRAWRILRTWSIVDHCRRPGPDLAGRRNYVIWPPRTAEVSGRFVSRSLTWAEILVPRCRDAAIVGTSQLFLR